MGNHLKDIVKAARTCADANDMDQVKRYLDQLNNYAEAEEAEEEKRKQAEKESQKRAKQEQGIAGTGASQKDEDKVQKAPEQASSLETDTTIPRSTARRT